VRLFLGGFDLTPTYKDVCNKFSVSYILNLVLVDEDDRRYFKQREIIIWRKPEKQKSATGEIANDVHFVPKDDTSL
jgi:vacuolar protein sorting-associated protein 26